MERIEDVEEVLHAQFAAAAGIQQEHRDRHQAPYLNTAQIKPKDQQAKGQHGDMDLSAVQPRDAFPLRITAVLEYSREHRCHASPEAIIDINDLIEHVYTRHCCEEYQ